MKRMSLIWIPSLALLAMGTAQAHPPSAAGQATQQGQASQQQAQPTPKPASATQVDQCNKAGNRLLGNLGKGRFSKASASFEPKLGVDKAKLQKVWAQMTTKFGNLKSSGQATQGQQVQGYTVVLVPVSFDKAHLDAQVVCDSKGAIGGLRFGRAPGSQS